MIARPLRIPAVVAFALTAALAVVPAAAFGKSANAAATETYLRANLKLVQIAKSHLAASEKAPITQVLARVRSECPKAGATSPQDPNSTHMSYEVIGAIVVAAYKSDVPAALAYARTVASLHWSSSAVTREVREHATDLKTVAALAPPNLCADVHAWAADGFTALPASTVAFDAKFEPSWVAIGLLPKGLGRFESSALKAIARRTTGVEEELQDGEARVAETGYESIMDTLELAP